MIQKLKMANSKFTIKELCGVLGIKPSTYYDQIKSKPLSEKKAAIVKVLKQTAIDTGHTYGKRRMQEQLKLEGITIGRYKTASMMKMANIKAIRPQKKHYYPDGGQCNKQFSNLLDRQFDQPKVNTHWVGDITYIHSHQGWSYLAAVFDLGAKEIVGWALSKHPTAELAKQALANAVSRKRPNTSKLMFHSDQGAQYTAKTFVGHCGTLKITQSMSRRGNCWDNAVMERFFRNLKTERLNCLSFTNHQAVIAEIESYIYFYNYKRLNSAIDYMTPNQKFMQMKKAA